MGLQLVRITKEVTFATYNSSGTHVDVFLPMGDAMTVRVDPQMWSIKDAGQGNRFIKMNVGRKNVGGSLSTYLFPSQATFFLGLAAGLTGTAPCLDLPSFTVDHIIYTDNSCATYGKRYLGCKFGDSSISCDDSDNGCLTTFKGSIIGSTAADITLSDFPNPSLSAYPADDPFQLYHTAENTGALTIGTVRHDYKSMTIDFKNVLKPFGGEKRFASRVNYFGRQVDFTARLLLTGNADRAVYEAGTKRAVSVIFDNGVNTATLDFGTNCAVMSLSDQFPIDDYFTQTIGFTALVDPTLSPATDLTITTT
jgi:hypothetical protein